MGNSINMENSRINAKVVLKRNDLPERILDEAEKLFAQSGFNGTSIREVTKRANCNLASVSYYFHGKENLYIEVFHRLMKTITEERIRRINQNLSEKGYQTDLESLIRSFAEIFLESFLKDGSGQQLMRLMMHERQDPHLPKGLFLNEVIQPVISIMRKLLIEVCPELSHIDADLCLHSIVAQLLNVLQAQDLFGELDRKQMPILDLQRSIKFIVRFSAGGIRQYLDEEINRAS